MNNVIRECMISDYEAIYLLNKKEMGYDFPIELTKKRLELLLKDKKHKIIVAECDKKVIGYIHVSKYDLLYYQPLVNIMGIAVQSEYKRKGIGRLLLQSAEEWAKETGATGIRLVSGETRTDAHEFYYACGYDSKKRQLNFFKQF